MPFGAVLTRALTEVENTPHERHAAAVSPSVTTCTTRLPSDCLDTWVNCTPGSPNNTVAPPTTPVVLPPSECFATSRLQKAKGFQSVDPLNALRFQVVRSESMSPEDLPPDHSVTPAGNRGKRRFRTRATDSPGGCGPSPPRALVRGRSGRFQVVVATPLSGGVGMGRAVGWAAAVTGRAAMYSPGRPPVSRRACRQRWERVGCQRRAKIDPFVPGEFECASQHTW